MIMSLTHSSTLNVSTAGSASSNGDDYNNNNNNNNKNNNNSMFLDHQTITNQTNENHAFNVNFSTLDFQNDGDSNISKQSNTQDAFSNKSSINPKDSVLSNDSSNRLLDSTEIPNRDNGASTVIPTTSTTNTTRTIKATDSNTEIIETPITTSNNNMNSKINKRLDRIPENLGPNGTTPSGKPRLFVCDVCTRAFARHEHLKRHERSHTKEKPFVCGVCQRQFSRRDLLLRHAQKLHAGCDDAIKRLRRRSTRSKSTASPTGATNSLTGISSNGASATIDLKNDVESLDINENLPSKRQKVANDEHVSIRNSSLLFGNNLTTNINNGGASRQPSAKLSSLHSASTGSIFKGRRSSFSAASAANYASVPQSQLQNNYYQDSVEFSTPQLLPVDSFPRSSGGVHKSINSWLSDINDLPGLDFLNNFSLNDAQGPEKQPQQQQHHDVDPIESVTPTSLISGSKVSSPGSRPIRSNGNRRKSQSRKSSTSNLNKINTKKDSDIFGYSFYDDDYTFSNQHHEFHDMKFSYPKLPSSYLKEYSSSSTPDGSSNTSSSNSNNSLMNARNLNDYELLSELEIPNYEEKILSAGYSFYESNDFAPSTISPSNLLNSQMENIDDQQFDDQAIKEEDDEDDEMMNIEEDCKDVNDTIDSSVSTLSDDVLFTENFKTNIERVLAKYPFVNIPPPDLPDLDMLNSYCQSFKDKFLSHYPFIHSSILNERSMCEYTKNEESPLDVTSNVCLPLLIATAGSLYSNNKKISADLYEISRRCIHVYLDLRKKNQDFEKETTHNSPLWLVQCLVLSVLYGLFADYDESDLNIVLRQVNALCTLIKVSKFTSLKFEHENIEINDGYFKEYILYQSKIRTVFVIFNISSMLTCFYDLNPFINYKEIKCDLPDLENYWACSNVEEFKQKCVENSSLNYCLNLNKILNDMLMNNQINYKLSEFGANIVMFGLLQYFYANKKSSLTNYSAGISPFHSNSSNMVKNYKWENLLIDQNLNINLESVLLKNISVIRSLMIDLSKVKEYMWNRRWNELSLEFMKLHPKNDDLIDACDYSIRTLSLIFINDVDSSNYKKCLSLTLQCLFFNFFYIAKFLHSFEKKVLKPSPSSTGPLLSTSNMKSSESKLISKNFSVYIKIAKFLADLEQILVRNFNYHDIESKLATKKFDESRYNFGEQPSVLNEADFSASLNVPQVIQVAKLSLSSSILKMGEFIFNLVFQKEMNFNIYKSLSDGLFHLRVYLESDQQQEISEKNTA